jgi:uncharacterized protein YndB with AHSA1/START domain
MVKLIEKQLEIKVEIQVSKPAEEVFEAIIDPDKMSNYFISEGSGRMEDGKEIIWKFPEFRFEFPIRVKEIRKSEYISYYWDIEDKELLVEITLKPLGKDKTLVTVTEKGMQNDEKGIKWLQGNTGGWANFLACLKAWLEYGINLRKGAFDYMSDKV